MIIAIGGDKGGTGKSHLATSLVVSLMQQGKRTGLVETDLNASAKNWIKRRIENKLEPIAFSEAYGDISSKIVKQAQLTDILIVDTAGHDSTEIRTTITVADILLIPVDPLAQVEADTLQKLTKIVREAQTVNPKLKAHILFYKCQANTYKEQKELRESLTSHEYWIKPLKSTVAFLRAFVRVMNDGKGVHELPTSISGAGKAKAQIELIIKEIGV